MKEVLPILQRMQSEMDITHKAAWMLVFQEVKPTFVFHCAAYTAVDKAEDEGKELR
jgi:dTDP-4-dehydrorhamnose reductase